MKRSRFHRHIATRREEPESAPHNDEIRVPEVRLIDDAGMIGVMPTPQALALAHERGLDLVLISPQAQPPVAKVTDYGKFIYQREKTQRKQRAASKTVEIKTIRLSVRIGDHDRDMRLEQAKKFLERGDKVRVELMLRGREKSHPDVGAQTVKDFNKLVLAAGPYKLEQDVRRAGNAFSSMIST